MFRKILSLSLFCLLIYPFVCTPALANTEAAKQVKFAEKAKAGVVKLGVGPDARITVKLRDKTKLAGYVSSAEANLFVVTDLKTGESTEVAYADVAQVKGHNLSTGAKIAIGIGIGVGITLLVLFILYAATYD
jgi:hypothetical protein